MNPTGTQWLPNAVLAGAQVSIALFANNVYTERNEVTFGDIRSSSCKPANTFIRCRVIAED